MCSYWGLQKIALRSPKSEFDTEVLVFVVENVLEDFQTLKHPVTQERGVGYSTLVALPPIEMIQKMKNVNTTK